MDHLLLPEGAKSWIKVPYDAKEEHYYEKFGYGFDKYPERRKWSDGDVMGQTTEARHRSDELGDSQPDVKDDRTLPSVEQLFQTWLFFGLIIEVLRLSKIKVTTNDLLLPLAESKEKSHIVTTECLPSLIIQWRDNYESTRDTSPFEVAMTFFERVRTILDFYCAGGRKRRSPNQYGQVQWLVRDEITTSIIAVAVTLRTAAHQIYGKRCPEGLRWPTANSEILRMRILRKWCRSDAAMVMEDFDIDGQYFIATAKGRSLEALDKHYKCTEDACHAKVEDGTYVTRHAEGCSGEDVHSEIKYVGHLGPEYDQEPKSLVEGVRKIMDRSHLPYVVWNHELHGIATSGYAKNLSLGLGKGFRTPPFVAISHVWADGMGNPFLNSLPDCQLDRIQKMVDNLCDNHLRHQEFDERPGFWMDTLCCLVGKDDEKYRKQSIKEMREIYKEAVAVLIIDPWVIEIPSTAPMSELCHRIYTSGWARRLWTHQEGYLGNEVFYQLQDRPMSLSEIHARTIRFETISAAKGQPTNFPSKAQGKTGTYYKAIKSIISSIDEGPLSTDNRWIAYKHLAESLAYRATSKIEDEIACVASVMGIPVGPFLEIKGKTPQEVAETRMVQFLKEIRRFRQGIIFNDYQRLKVPGFRWAPASLLGHRSSGLGDLEDSEPREILDCQTLDPNDSQVHFSSIGMTLDLNKLAAKGYIVAPWASSARYLLMKENGKEVKFPPFGLPVDYPGYKIKFSGDHKLTVNMAERRFGLTTTSVENVADVAPSVKVETTPSSKRPPSTGKTSSFGKIPSFGITSSFEKSPSFGKTSSTDKIPSTGSSPFFGINPLFSAIPPPLEYVVFVAENNVLWERGETYALILQGPLDQNEDEIQAMIGRKLSGPGLLNWVESLCSAVVRRVKEADKKNMKFGLDFVDLPEAKTSWVIT